jgi:hypothetical protein
MQVAGCRRNYGSFVRRHVDVEAQNLNEFLDRCVVGGVGGIGSKRRSGSAPGSECLESPTRVRHWGQ